MPQHFPEVTVLEEHEFTHGVGGATKTFYLAAGPPNGPLLIFIHGWPAIAKTWKPQLEAFASLGFRVVAPDMPGWLLSVVVEIECQGVCAYHVLIGN